MAAILGPGGRQSGSERGRDIGGGKEQSNDERSQTLPSGGGAREKRKVRKFASKRKPRWNEECDKVVANRFRVLAALYRDINMSNLIEKR